MRTKAKAFGLVLLLLGGVLGACGGGAVSQEGLAGTYVLDVERTLAARGATLAGEAPGPGPGSAALVLGQDLSPQAYRLELRSDGTYTLVRETEGGAYATEGRWRKALDGRLEARTTRMGGEAVEESEAPAEPIAVEPGYLVLDPDGRPVYLRK